jgi:iron complex transport system substrate-binding protein
MWSTASPRTPLIMLFMAMKLHPELFADVDFEKEVDLFYKRVFGIPLDRVKAVENLSRRSKL